MLNLPTPNQPGSAVYSSACFKARRSSPRRIASHVRSIYLTPTRAQHCTSNVPEFYGVHIGELSLKDVLQQWFLEGTAPQQTIESCTGFGCGQCHRKKPAKGSGLRLPPLLPMPPLPPAHTADLTLSADGAAMYVSLPSPPPVHQYEPLPRITGADH